MTIPQIKVLQLEQFISFLQIKTDEVLLFAMNDV